ncbi:MAG: TldD/PmbA family protein [Candidatus Helarchaeota archaeon]|nr:TldD/PmbA family protein [Candidatus Helarchaeota archaeon]
MKDIDSIMELLVDRLKAMEIPMWDVYSKTIDVHENQFRNYDLEITRYAVNTYYIIRTFYDKEDQFGVGVVKANSPDPNHIDSYIKTSQKLAKLNVTSKFNLPQPGQSYPNIKTAEDKVIADPEGVLQEKTEILQNVVQDLKQVQPTFGKLRIYISSKALRNSEDLSLTGSRTSLYLEYPLKAEAAGKLAEFWGRCDVKNSNQLDLQNRLSHWAGIATASLHTKVPPATKSITVIFPPNVLRDAFFNTLGSHSTGRLLSEGISKFKKGEKVAIDEFTLIDNGLMAGGIAVANWDGEGNPQRVNQIIKDGIFENFLFDQKYAALKKTKSTGNGLRTADGTISNSFTNLEINAGSESLDELIESVKYGVMIEEFSWLNPSAVTGDFGSEIRNGYLIENGKKKYSIKGGNLSGNAFEMIKAIEGASKQRVIEENYKFPYLKLSGLILSS